MSLMLSILSFYRPTATDVISRVSTTADGSQSEHAFGAGAYQPQISADGRDVVFTSRADNLVPGDTNGWDDVFLKDLQTGTVLRASTSADGTQANFIGAENPHMSADGRLVVFTSGADNLVPDDTNGTDDIFLKDLQTGTVRRISTNAQNEGSLGGASGDARISPDGHSVVFGSHAPDLVDGDDNGVSDVFLKNVDTGAISRISVAADGTEGNGNSNRPDFSADGRYVVFDSDATNLVAGDTNGATDIFRKDLQTGAIVRITAADGTQGSGDSFGAHVSADGRYVLFESKAGNLVAGDTNGQTDVFLKDIQTGSITRVSTATDGTQALGGESTLAHMSADARYAVFQSDATNLVAGDTNSATDIFLKDVTTGALICISTAADGTQATGSGNHDSSWADITPDGRYVVFSSYAGNLVANDTNQDSDVFRVDTRQLANREAIGQNRYVEAKFGVGSATSVKIDWGDGHVDAMAPQESAAAFQHTYATSGTKIAQVTIKDRAQTWTVPYSVDLTSGQMVRNTKMADARVGTSHPDSLHGDNYANTLKGLSGNDTLKGEAGNDKLYGGAGKDVLYGSTGKDIFVFDAKPNTKTNLDKIMDFNVKDDTIWLDNHYFAKLGKGTTVKPGKLNAKFFTVGDHAKDKNDYLIYDNKKGVLWYDADGSGAHKAVEIATLKKGLKMTYHDFFVI